MADKNIPNIDEPQIVTWVEQPLLQLAKIAPDGTILKGIDADSAPLGSREIWLLCLDTLDIPLTSDKAADLAQNCVRQVPHPVLGHPIPTFAISSSAGLAMLEVAHALKKRDDRIADLKQRVETLESEAELNHQAVLGRLDEVEALVEASDQDRARDRETLRRGLANLPVPAAAPATLGAPVTPPAVEQPHEHAADADAAPPKEETEA